MRDKGLTVFSLWNPDSPLTEVDLFVESPFDDFSRAYSDAIHLELAPGLSAAIVGFEDLIALKRKAGRSQDLIDIENLKRLLGEDDAD